MMNAVVVHEAKVGERRQLENTVKVENAQKLLSIHRAGLLDGGSEVLVIPGNHFSHSLRLIFITWLHMEAAFGDFLQELYIDARNMPGQIPRGSCFRIGTIIALLVGYRRDDFSRGLHLFC